MAAAPVMSLEYFVRWIEPEPESEEESEESEEQDDDSDIPFLDEIHDMEKEIQDGVEQDEKNSESRTYDKKQPERLA